jgi:hypothetical protein
VRFGGSFSLRERWAVSIIFLTGAMQEMHGLGSELGQAWLACTGMASSYPGPVNSGERLNLFFSPIAVQWPHCCAVDLSSS